MQEAGQQEVDSAAYEMLESSFDNKEDLEDDEYGEYDDDDSDVYGLMTVNQAITNHRYPDIVGHDEVVNFSEKLNVRHQKASIMGSQGFAQAKLKQARPAA